MFAMVLHDRGRVLASYGTHARTYFGLVWMCEVLEEHAYSDVSAEAWDNIIHCTYRR